MYEYMLGVDIGGSGIKAAIVNLHKGELHTERIKITTPQPSTPAAVVKVIHKLKTALKWDQGPIGFGFPAPVLNGVTMTASNIDDSWIGFHAQEFLEKELGHPCFIVNDADAAGLGELRYGAAAGYSGTVILLTLGTGIGSALLHHGTLVPNTELGHLMYRNSILEKYASNKARKDGKMSYSQWGKELNAAMSYIYRLCYPDVFILGGGISKRFDNYSKYLNPGAPVIPAKNFNEAGIIGAAVFAAIESRVQQKG